MSTELERRLIAAFEAEADRARLVNPDRPASPNTPPVPLRPAASSRRPWRVATVAVGVAAAVAIVLGTVVVVSNDDDPDRLTPVDSTPAPDPTPTDPVPTTVDSGEVVPVPGTDPTIPVTELSPPTVPPLPGAPASLWVDLEPGATAPLPHAPIAARYGAQPVWTGTEIIVLGGLDDSGRSSQEAAAFDPAAGTWRRIASMPSEVSPSVVLWTGTEMLVWGGGARGSASAAYDPANDVWRTIADPPVPGTAAFWIGEEALFVRDGDANDDGYFDSPSSTSYAYDPATDRWRTLANGSWGRPVGWVSGPSTSAVWTGTNIITVTDTDTSAGLLLNSYDPATDEWRALEGFDSVRLPVVVREPNAPGTVALVPLDPGVPVEMLDAAGNVIGELAGRPDELASTCQRPAGDESCFLTSLRAVSLGTEVLFWHSNDGWALDTTTQTWRALPLDGRQPGWDGTEVVAAGDLLFAWGAGRDGLVYRAAAQD